MVVFSFDLACKVVVFLGSRVVVSLRRIVVGDFPGQFLLVYFGLVILSHRLCSEQDFGLCFAGAVENSHWGLEYTHTLP